MAVVKSGIVGVITNQPKSENDIRVEVIDNSTETRATKKSSRAQLKGGVGNISFGGPK